MDDGTRDFGTTVDRYPAVSDRGVDMSLIRRLLKLTPAERLALGVSNSNAMLEFLARARRNRESQE